VVGHWLLQDFSSGNAIASGDGVCPAQGSQICGVNSSSIYPPVDMMGPTALYSRGFGPAEGDYFYQSSAIYSPTGALISTSPLNGSNSLELSGSGGASLQVLSSGAIYSASDNDVVSQSSGATTWVSQDPFQVWNTIPAGAATGTQVIFAEGPLVLAQPRP
jgi:hypothetical protein